MTIFESIFLGIIQGLTEFLPISSSAHLVLVPFWFNWQFPTEQIFVFDVLVQMGTLAAVIIFFWKDLIRIITAAIKGLIDRKPLQTEEAKLGWWIILATIPAGIFGVLVKDQVEAAFNNPVMTAVFLLLTAALLIIAERFGKRQKELNQITWLDAIIIGVFQALSIFPGISRSGSTISGAMIRNINRPAAARFSFLMSIPVMIAAGGLAVLDLLDMPGLSSFLPIVIIGVLAAGVVGYFSIRWLLQYLQRHSFYGFSIYCTLAAVLTFIIASIRG
jgi:undecaprenyl-diphosphatase